MSLQPNKPYRAATPAERALGKLLRDREPNAWTAIGHSADKWMVRLDFDNYLDVEIWTWKRGSAPIQVELTVDGQTNTTEGVTA